MRGLSGSRQDYLKALYSLSPAGEAVAPSRLAARLGVSAPSVTNMLGRLAAERLVAHSRRSGARLTTRGRREALAMVRRYRILETFRVQVLGFDWSEVHDDAEILEHHISDRVLEAIDRLVGHPNEDPHGHVIPDRNGHVRRRALLPVTAVPEGDRATVAEIRDADPEHMARWKRIGLVPGAVIHMMKVRPLEDVYEVEVAGKRMVTGTEGLDGVMVEKGRSRARRKARAASGRG